MFDFSQNLNKIIEPLELIYIKQLHMIIFLVTVSAVDLWNVDIEHCTVWCMQIYDEIDFSFFIFFYNSSRPEPTIYSLKRSGK
jgi:hypothetical protein